MTCDVCGEREAIVNLTQIENGEATAMHLCERCAAERGVEPPAPGKTPLGGFLAAMGEAGASGSDACPACGATLQTFRESGRLGCAECWRAFETSLRELVRRLHGSTFHVGERYEHQTGESSVVQLEGELREKLREAVASENFELAAELRDRLRIME
jgi:protein arginine kinase activator